MPIEETVKELTKLCFIKNRVNEDRLYQWSIPEHLDCAHGKCDGYDTTCNSYTSLNEIKRT